MITRLTILLPAAAALVGLLVSRWARTASGVAVGASLATLVLAVVGWAQGGSRATLLPAPHAGDLRIPLIVSGTPTYWAVAAVVALVACAVQVYAVWYLADDDRHPRFAATVSLFAAAMLLVVLSRDLVLTLLGWEVMGWCSYLLIGHWSRRESARRAAHKAFLVTRVADVGFVLGTIALATGARSTDLHAVVLAWSGAGDCPDPGTGAAVCAGTDQRMLSIGLCLLVVGVLGKSALVPFQDWLPDAMEGPTPASALIHAATMVAAGTVVLGHLFPLLVMAEPARWLLALSAAVSMLLAAVLAFGQSDLKRLLAWSTVSQVAIMLGGLAAVPGVTGPTTTGLAVTGDPQVLARLVLRASGADAALFHMWSHAIFKSLLFLAIGWLGLVAGATSARALRGSAKARPLARVAFLFGLFSLAGVPLTVGGLSKEHVLTAVVGGATVPSGPAVVVLVALVPTIVLTAAYATRAWLVVTDEARHGDTGEQAVVSPAAADAGLGAAADASPHAGPHASPHAGPHASAPPLAVRAVIGGLLGLTVLGGLVLRTGAFEVHGIELLWTLVTIVLVVLGALVAVSAARHMPGGDGAARLGARARWWDAGLGADTAYVRLVARPTTALARWVAFVDREVVDGYVSGAGLLARTAGLLTDRSHQRQRPSSGVMLVVLGLLVLAALGVLAWR